MMESTDDDSHLSQFPFHFDLDLRVFTRSPSPSASTPVPSLVPSSPSSTPPPSIPAHQPPLADSTTAMQSKSDKTTPARSVFGPIPNRTYHEGFMRQAIDMAELALASDETPVGCVFVRDGQVIGRGINGTNASLNVPLPPFLRSSTSTLT